MVKFLVIRFSSIGDIVLTTPVIRCLNQQVEDAEVHFLTRQAYAGLMSGNPYISRIHLFDSDLRKLVQTLREEEYDYVIDLQHSIRSARIKNALKRMYFSVNKLNFRKWIYVNFKINRMPPRHIVDRYLDTVSLFDVKNDLRGLDHFIPATEEFDTSGLPAPFRNGYIALVLGARHATKRIPEEKLVEICDRLKYPVVMIGGEEDREPGDTVIKKSVHRHIYNACGTTSVHGSASLVGQSNCVLTNDTGLMHIAAALKKRIVTVWGNTVPEFGMYPYMPDPESVSFGVRGLNCRPCSKIGFDQCPKKHFRCMLQQDAGKIADAVNALYR